MAKQFDRDLKKYERQLAAFLSPDKVHAHAVARHAKEVVNAVLAAAKGGVGPGGKPYPPWSEAYAKQLGAKAGTKPFLVGVDKPDMLDRKRFNWIIKKNTGQLFLEWKGPVYGLVHQGKALGGTGYAGNSKYPVRAWMHFLSQLADAAVWKMYRLVMGERTAKFNAGNLK